MSLKLLASISNIFLYTIFVIVFLGFGDFPAVPWQNNIVVVETLAYVFVFVSFVFLGMYQCLHAKEIKKSGFVMQKKHFLFQNIFYYSEYFILLVTFLYALLTQTVPFTSTTVRILFYIFFPLFFVVSSVTSVLESIVRVEIKIYKSKEI